MHGKNGKSSFSSSSSSSSSLATGSFYFSFSLPNGKLQIAELLLGLYTYVELEQPEGLGLGS
jgi:hypothetical protein